MSRDAEIESIQFGVLSEEEIIQRSVVKITEQTMYHKYLPKEGGLCDTRMGPPDRRVNCATCHQDILNCPGHTGHMEVPIPLYHGLEIYNPILRSLHYKYMQYQRKRYDLFNHISKICREYTQCSYCQATQPKYERRIYNRVMEIAIIWPSEVLESWKPLLASDIETLETRQKRLSLQPVPTAEEYESKEEKQRREQINEKRTEEKYLATKLFTSKDAYNILKHVPKQDAKWMGLYQTHPKDLMINVLLIPPMAIRPSIMISDGSRSRGQNDLTRKLVEIQKLCETVKKQMAKYPDALEPGPDRHMIPRELRSSIQELQYHVATYMNNEIRGLKVATSRNGVPHKCITKRLKGKNGRFRGNLSGKRCDFTGRSAISPDGYIDIEYIGVPREIALVLTRPKTVNSYINNKTELQKRIIIGANDIKGAKTVRFSDDPNGTLIYLQACNEQRRHEIAHQLKDGDVIEIPLQDEDVILFNRQPSLHKKSMMAHKTKIMDGYTFRMNVSACNPYNADFDGDEMNIHVPQDERCQSEMKNIMLLSELMLNQQNNRPSFGLIQNALLASYLLTRKDTFLTREEFMQYMCQVEKTMQMYNPQYIVPPPSIYKPVPLWTGKQLFSILFPKTLNMKKHVRDLNLDDVRLMTPMSGLSDDCRLAFDPMERQIIVQSGELLSGCVCKETAGAVSNGFVHVLAKDFHSQVAARFLSDAQRLVNEWVSNIGFTVGIKDCIMDTFIEQGVNKIIQDTMQSVQDVYKVTNVPLSLKDSKATSMLTSVLKKNNSLIQSQMSIDTNNIYAMRDAGSKGSGVNTSQIMGCVGQQMVNGQRIQSKQQQQQQNKTRALSCFDYGDTHPKAHGFCDRSYINGLDAVSFFFHCMGGREGLIDTSVKTSTAGYFTRRLTKSLESAQVDYHLTVRNAEQYIIWFSYGGDGQDPQYLETMNLHFLKETVQQWVDYISSPSSSSSSWVQQEECQTFVQLCRECVQVKYNFVKQEFDTMVLLPIQLERLITNIEQKYKNKNNNNNNNNNTATTTIDPVYVVVRVKKCLQELLKFNHGQGTLFLRTAVMYYFNSKRLLHHSWTTDMLNEALNMIEISLYKYSIQPGEMVGVLSSQSIGEPSMQLTLTTFHLAGVGNVFVNGGIPRLIEIFNLSQNIHTPSITIAFKPMYQKQELVQYIAQTLPITFLFNIVAVCETVYEPDYKTTHILEDQFIVQVANLFRDHVIMCSQASHYIIRYTLDKKICQDKQLTPMLVANIVREFLGFKAEVLYSSTHDATWAIRITLFGIRDKILAQTSLPESEQLFYEETLVQSEMYRYMKQIYIMGVEGITGVNVRTSTIYTIDKDNKIVPRSIFLIDTIGTNLSHVWSMDHIDWVHTISNDIHEVYKTLGLLAAITCLFREIKTVLMMDGGGYVNLRHIVLVVFIMCFRGYLMPLDRHGINRVDTGVLMRASYEETMEMCVNASVFNERDPLQGVTENMIMGKLVPMGTMCMDVLVNPPDGPYKGIHDSYVQHTQQEKYGHMTLPSSSSSLTSSSKLPYYHQHQHQHHHNNCYHSTHQPQRVLRSAITEWNHLISEQQQQQQQYDNNNELFPPEPTFTTCTLTTSATISNNTNTIPLQEKEPVISLLSNIYTNNNNKCIPCVYLSKDSYYPRSPKDIFSKDKMEHIVHDHHHHNHHNHNQEEEYQPRSPCDITNFTTHANTHTNTIVTIQQPATISSSLPDNVNPALLHPLLRSLIPDKQSELFEPYIENHQILHTSSLPSTTPLFNIHTLNKK